MKRDLVDELYKTAYKRYREKYPNKNFVIINYSIKYFNYNYYYY